MISTEIMPEVRSQHIVSRPLFRVHKLLRRLVFFSISMEADALDVYDLYNHVVQMLSVRQTYQGKGNDIITISK